MPFFEEMCDGGAKNKKRAKVALLTRLGGANTVSLNQSDIDLLRSSKRIVLIVSKKFVNEEWTNQVFKDTLVEINRTDAYCSIILVNLSEIEWDNLEGMGKEIELSKNIGWVSRARNHLANRVKYNCGIKDVECVDFNATTFWSDLSYLMPRHRYEPIRINVKSKSGKPQLK